MRTSRYENQIAIDIDRIGKYTDKDNELKLTLIKIDLIETLERSLKPYGQLISLGGFVSTSHGENHYEIPGQVILKVESAMANLLIAYTTINPEIDIELILNDFL